MKKFLLLISILLTAGCSVDQVEYNLDNEIQLIDASVIDACSAYNFDFNLDGEFYGTGTIRNYKDYFQLTISSADGIQLSKLSVDIAKSPENFPRKGNGELKTSQFYYNENLEKNTSEIEEKFLFSPLKVNIGETVYISIAAEFRQGNRKIALFAKEEVLEENLNYFEYSVRFDNYAGNDNSDEITLAQAEAIPSDDELRKLYVNLLDEGVEPDGTYFPTISQIVDSFNSGEKLGSYSTVYTVGEGECSDSAILTLIVVE